MGFRFKKSIQIFPGLKLNISKSGVSTTLGGRGASLNIGNRGVSTTLDIPGTGLSYTKKLSSTNSNHFNSQINNSLPSPSSIIVDNNGKVYFIDSNNNLFDDNINKKLKQIYKEDVDMAIKEKEEEINKLTFSILNIHTDLYMPVDWSKELNVKPFISEQFTEYLPSKFEVEKEIEKEIASQNGFFKSIFNSNKIKNDILSKTEVKYNSLLNEYEIKKNDFFNNQKKLEYRHNIDEQKRVSILKGVLNGNISCMEDFLELKLSDLDFPLNTNISFEIIDNHTVFLDVDLPEIEDIPLEKANITSTGKLSVKQKSQKELRKNYATVVCGIAIKICSFVFYCLHTCDTIIISGYTQRLDKSVGIVKDTYIYSLEVDKTKFYSINYDLADIILTINNFEPLINLNGNYEFKEIIPYDCHS